MKKLIWVTYCLLSLQVLYAGTLVEQKLNWQGFERGYLLYVPDSYNPQIPAPLLFDLHGGGGTAANTIKLTFGGFNKLADKHGFLVVYPNGLGKQWNDGRVDILKEQFQDVDDVGFILEIVSRIKKAYSINSQRIFTTGMSNGGFMSTRLLCDAADVFRAGAIVTATISEAYFPECHPSQPVGVLVMNGTEDPLVPYEGGPIKVLRKTRGIVLSTDAFMAFWAEQNGCEISGAAVQLPNTAPYDGTTTQVTTYENCSEGGALTLYSVNGGGHTWPGGKQYLGRRVIGKTARDFDACEVIWAFFSSL
ncbi:MAG TPA: PHB depolymerase family esterase [Flavobacteriaceae bacterium]|nr:prolyl oligopeptidase family serine peptidase [Alteromonas sp.]HPF12344.1 PHB depolymerase family esterase [Flavobacteriaceae bacterium]HQU22499.1 PHB depolymerase family esterase [Flavobacteriaceae bacterium]HQU66459.1 PHB depolymerase family esterase [Flavobacteriaceae bacterium]